jgi:dsDNA-binding SOS-regulon protein
MLPYLKGNKMELRQVFTTEDGKVFDSKAEALDYLRRPKIQAALANVTGGKAELSMWLLDNQEVVEGAFEIGTIKRVTKSERNRLAKALEVLKEVENPKLAFLQENTDAIFESFRWPKVERMDDDQKLLAARNSLIHASEGNEKLADWVIANKDAILNAYEAGKVKRAINPKAAEALAAYRAQKAAEKVAKEAAE